MMRLRSSSPRPAHGSKPGIFADVKGDFEAACIEFVGTVMFLLIGFGGIQAAGDAIAGDENASFINRIMYISTVMGLALLVSAWLFFRATGGLFNPNVSLALLLAGVIGPVRFVFYCIAQLLGGIAAAGLILALLPGELYSNTGPSSSINSAQAVFIEMFITAALCLSVLMLGAEKHKATPFAPVGVGLTLFACHLFAVMYTGASMNTARSFGPAVVSGFPDGRHWIYWVGPGLGSLFASGLYALLKYFKYWQFNPASDAQHESASPDPAPPRSGEPDIEAGRSEKAPRQS